MHVNARVLIILFRKGIPFPRGYLLHGVRGRYVRDPKLDSCADVPPSGKTSLIHSLVGELGLGIYVVSLSSRGCVFGSSPSFPG